MWSLLKSYLDLRRAAGFKLRAAEYRLGSYVRAAEDRGESHIRKETALAWAATASSAGERHLRLRDLKIFARHLRAEDPGHELPPENAFPYRERVRLPHIFTDEEVLLVLHAASRLGNRNSGKGDTYCTLFALLATTGLRIGEALRLKVGDVTADVLRVENTKFSKSRLVPLHATTGAALAGYRARWRGVAEADAPFFVSPRGKALAYSTVRDAFRDTIRRAIPIRQAWVTDPRSSPHMHDLRHTFAVKALEACPESRRAINRHMLALSTYLGHSSVASTYWYLHVTPRLMTDIADACEAWGTRPEED